MKTDTATTDLPPTPTLFDVARRGGIWVGGRFYGHYPPQQPAFDALEAEAHSAAAGGGSADILGTTWLGLA